MPRLHFGGGRCCGALRWCNIAFNGSGIPTNISHMPRRIIGTRLGGGGKGGGKGGRGSEEEEGETKGIDSSLMTS